MLRSSPAAAIAAIVGTALPALADFVPVSQSRRASATAQAWNLIGGINSVPGTPVTQEFIAPDFSPFIQTAAAQANGSVGAQGVANVQQNSIINPTQIHATGSMLSTAHLGSLTTPGHASGTYEMQVRFSISDATSVRLLSSLGLTSALPHVENTADASTELIKHTIAGDQSLLLSQVAWSGSHQASVDQIFSLDPGEYSLHVFGHANAILNALDLNTSIGGNIDVTLSVVPAPASTLAMLALACVAAKRRRA